ncbi:MAG: DNA-protecting protein DprA [Acidobacteria bacterium]|nr:DNA-protecting protein DprA [Acidobacteriota bacterium]
MDWVSLHRASGCSLRAKKTALLENGGNPVAALDFLKGRGVRSDEKKDKIIMKQVKTLGGWIMTFGEADYPDLLKEIADPPLCLFGVGNRNALSRPAIAFVGTRRATQYGFNACIKLIRELSPANPVIVSGMASGIDTRAHVSALENNLQTVAVMGTGLNVIYPRENRKLFQSIVNQGAVISECDPDTKPEPFRFPVRNRIISGISTGVVIVEAREKSGTLITLRLALEQNREVFAVPGRLFDRASTSTNRAIKKGEAKLITCANDILDELIAFDIPGKSDTVVSESAPGLLCYLGETARSIDDLEALSGLSRNQVLMEVTVLEMDGRIEKNGANQFRKRV